MNCPRCHNLAGSSTEAAHVWTCGACAVSFLAIPGSQAGIDNPDQPAPQATLASGRSPETVAPSVLVLDPNLLERYQIIENIGVGATAWVYRAIDRASAEPVAIKFLARQPGHVMRERFQREARLLARIDHPHVLRLFAVGETDGRPYLVSELCESGTLRGLMEFGPVPLSEAVHKARNILLALAACHAAGVIHRDLKPENILLAHDDEVRLADLGIAREDESVAAALTPSGAMMGTPRYMAPEQVRGEQATAAADIYAAGVLLFEMVAGVPPFAARHVFDLMRSHLDSPPPALRQLVPGAPELLEATISRALAKEPGARFPTAESFARELERCLRVLSSEEADSPWVSASFAPAAAAAAVATDAPAFEGSAVPRRGASRAAQVGLFVLAVGGLALASRGPGGANAGGTAPATDASADLAGKSAELRTVDALLDRAPPDAASQAALRVHLDRAARARARGDHGAAVDELERALHEAGRIRDGGRARFDTLRALARSEIARGHRESATLRAREALALAADLGGQEGQGPEDADVRALASPGR